MLYFVKSVYKYENYTCDWTSSWNKWIRVHASAFNAKEFIKVLWNNKDFEVNSKYEDCYINRIHM